MAVDRMKPSSGQSLGGIGVWLSQHYGVVGLLLLAGLIPVGVIMRSGNEIGTTNRFSKQTAGLYSGQGRRLQTESFDFATQLEMTVCLHEDHTTDAATITPEQFKLAVATVLELDSMEFISTDGTIDKCFVDDWEVRVSVYNTKDVATGETASEVASGQVDRIYYDQINEPTFFSAIAEAITNLDPEITAEESDFDLESLGFLVIWLDADGTATTASTTRGEDVVSIGGTDVWWPWWAWLIYAAVVLCCICPVLFFFFKWRRDKNANEDGFNRGVGKKNTGPSPVGATSNPYGQSREEYKNGQ
ncbi:unnamed protein product [Choristocarpus tenellus]